MGDAPGALLTSNERSSIRAGHSYNRSRSTSCIGQLQSRHVLGPIVSYTITFNLTLSVQYEHFLVGAMPRLSRWNPLSMRRCELSGTWDDIWRFWGWENMNENDDLLQWRCRWRRWKFVAQPCSILSRRPTGRRVSTWWSRPRFVDPCANWLPRGFATITKTPESVTYDRVPEALKRAARYYVRGAKINAPVSVATEDHSRLPGKVRIARAGAHCTGVAQSWFGGRSISSR